MKSIRKILLGITGIVLGIGILSHQSANTKNVQTVAVPTIQATQSFAHQIASPEVSISPTASPTAIVRATVTPVPVTPKPTTHAPLSNSNYYVNSSGNEVHSPAYSETVPVGASAQCRDGSYSFSAHRNGTCSHHGGVAEWL
ncbi:MAG: DUF3761 domain-containing protein [Candidatus Andersenbacteria bacterium]|nr:DUF3761 domain-containing protein [Candidatus Andersenbacteria bacterium]